jgi:hypothetical protein
MLTTRQQQSNYFGAEASRVLTQEKIVKLSTGIPQE